MISTALFAAVLATAAPPQGPTIEVLSLRHLTSAQQPQQTTPWGTFLRRQDGDFALVPIRSDSPGLDTITQVLQHPAVPEDQLRLLQEDATLIAIGRAADVQQVRERLALVSSLLARPCRIEFAVWDTTDGETPPPFLDPGQLQTFVGNRQPLWRCISATHCGHAAVLERLRWSDYVRGVVGMVAQKQSMTHPYVDSYGEGGQALVHVHGLVGSDDLVVHLQFAVAQRRGVVRTVQTGMAGAADLEMPVLETDHGACSGRIQNGGALAITLRGHAVGGSQLVLTCRVDCAPMPLDAGREIGLFPIGAMSSAALTQPIELGTGTDDLAGTFGEPAQQFGHLSAERLVELAGLAVGTEEVSIEVLGDHLYVRGTGEQRVRIENVLRGVQDQVIRNATLQHVAQLAPSEAATAGAPSQSVLHELTLPTLVGRQVVAVRMLETTTVHRLEAQIAQEASLLDPRITELQSGTWLRACLLPAGRGLHLDATIRCSHAPMPTTRTVMPGGGVLMPLDIATRTIRHTDALASGKPAEHGDGPSVAIEGRFYRSVLATTARW